MRLERVRPATASAGEEEPAIFHSSKHALLRPCERERESGYALRGLAEGLRETLPAMMAEMGLRHLPIN